MLRNSIWFRGKNLGISFAKPSWVSGFLKDIGLKEERAGAQGQVASQYNTLGEQIQASAVKARGLLGRAY